MQPSLPTIPLFLQKLRLTYAYFSGEEVIGRIEVQVIEGYAAYRPHTQRAIKNQTVPALSARLKSDFAALVLG